MNKLLTIIILFLCMAIHGNAQIAAKDSTRVSTEVVAEAQLKKLTRELDLTKEQEMDIFKLLSSKKESQPESVTAWDDLMKLLTFQQKGTYLRLLELDAKSNQNLKPTHGLKSTTTADHTLTLNTTDKFKDVSLALNNHPDGAAGADWTYNNYSRITAMAWTYSGMTQFSRTVMKFILDQIPAGSQILAATLHLYSDPTVTSGSASNGNSQLSGSNEFYIERIAEPWSDQTVTWNNQPTTTTQNRLLIPASTSTTENISIDLTDMVQSWVNTPETNYGIKMFLQNEVHYRARTYGSMDHINTAIRPRLVVEYNTIETVMEYFYDDAGNRIARQIIVLPNNMKSGTLANANENMDPIPLKTDWENMVITLFPNPTAGDISLSFKGTLADESISYQVFNVSGTAVLNGQINATQMTKLPISGLSPGVYILVLQHGAAKKTWKIVKQ